MGFSARDPAARTTDARSSSGVGQTTNDSSSGPSIVCRSAARTHVRGPRADVQQRVGARRHPVDRDDVLERDERRRQTPFPVETEAHASVAKTLSENPLRGVDRCRVVEQQSATAPRCVAPSRARAFLGGRIGRIEQAARREAPSRARVCLGVRIVRDDLVAGGRPCLPRLL